MTYSLDFRHTITQTDLSSIKAAIETTALTVKQLTR
jgi:hypothetical protein